MAEFAGIEFTAHVPGSPEESWSMGAAKIRRTIDVAWGDRFDYIKASIGYSKLLTSSGHSYVSRVLPQPHPEYPWLFCTAIPRVEGIGFRGMGSTSDGDFEVYETARLTVEYEAVLYQVLPDDSPLVVGANMLADEAKLERYITRTYHPAAEFLTLGTNFLHWVDNPVPAKPAALLYSVPRIVPFVEVGYTWHQVPAIPLGNIRDAFQTVNNDYFDPNNPNGPNIGEPPGYEPGTLLLVAADIEPIRQPFNTSGPYNPNLVYNIHYRMKYLPNKDYSTGDPLGHNYFPRRKNDLTVNLNLVTDTGQPPGPGIVGGVSGGTGRPVYAATDFNKLFRF
jgi:hypothetical protein